jgi:hypothetical protein
MYISIIIILASIIKSLQIANCVANAEDIGAQIFEKVNVVSDLIKLPIFVKSILFC